MKRQKQGKRGESFATTNLQEGDSIRLDFFDAQGKECVISSLGRPVGETGFTISFIRKEGDHIRFSNGDDKRFVLGDYSIARDIIDLIAEVSYLQIEPQQHPRDNTIIFPLLALK